MNEQNLIGNILSEDPDSDLETPEKYPKTRRFVLLNHEELEQIQRSKTAPSEFLCFSNWPKSEPFLDVSAPEFVPVMPSEPSLSGEVLSMALDQQGSRYLQQLFQTGMPSERETIFSEVFKTIYSLITDVFGNYVV